MKSTRRRDPETHWTGKGNQWYVGMNALIGVDSAPWAGAWKPRKVAGSGGQGALLLGLFGLLFIALPPIGKRNNLCIFAADSTGQRNTFAEHLCGRMKAKRFARPLVQFEAMTLRRRTVEHVFGMLKHWMGSTHFLTKTLAHVGHRARPACTGFET